MVFRTNNWLLPLFLVLMASMTYSAPFLDPIDECILICDACFKGQTLLNCANDCLFTSGEMHQHWRNHCPHFDAKVPIVQIM